MDAVQSELIRDLVKRVSGASLSLWMPFTSTCFKTESATSTASLDAVDLLQSATSTAHLITPRKTDSASLIHLHNLSTPFNLPCFRIPVDINGTYLSSHPTPNDPTWTPFELSIKLPSATSPARPYRLLTPGTTDSASSTDPQSHLDAVQFDLLRIPDTNTASRSSRATRSMPCLQSLQELSSKLTPGWRLTSAGVTDFKYCFTLLPNGSLRLQAHQPHGFGDYARISHQYKVLNLESR
ncbi:hypothetical protein C8R46DRAFT_1235803 [Mycena filopes]|nr:hypothetical protein C8R46DRAFT_1235803 [Mycena filopes]